MECRISQELYTAALQSHTCWHSLFSVLLTSMPLPSREPSPPPVEWSSTVFDTSGTTSSSWVRHRSICLPCSLEGRWRCYRYTRGRSCISAQLDSGFCEVLPASALFLRR